jgi:transcription-repair coupling factor (superfamily II helicase)
VIGIKQLCRQAGVEKVDAGPKGALLTLYENRFANPESLVAYIQKQAGTVKLRPDQKLVFMRVWDDSRVRMRGVRRLMEELAELAEA